MKKLIVVISVLLAASMFMFSAAVSAGSGSYLIGDTDGSGVVSIEDVTLIQKVLAELVADTDGSITKLISIRRVEAAKTLLLKENLSIAEIAEKVGFSDYNYFTKIFKKIMDCTPSEYRKLKNK